MLRKLIAGALFLTAASLAACSSSDPQGTGTGGSSATGGSTGTGGTGVTALPQLTVSGNKLQDKRAYRHSGYPGGLRKETYAELLRKRPDRVVEQAVKGMLPKNTLGRKMLSKLKVYAGPDHPHAAQQPTPFEITQIAQ